MACATAAATTMLGAWLWRKWKATMERRRELEQLIVVNQASLTRQKQVRFLPNATCFAKALSRGCTFLTVRCASGSLLGHVPA